MKCEAVTCQHCQLTKLSISYGYCQLDNPLVNEETSHCLNYSDRKLGTKKD